MARFRGSLKEWRRYIDERTRAVQEQADDCIDPDAPALKPSSGHARTPSDSVEAILEKQRAIRDEIDSPSSALPPPTVVEAAAMFHLLPPSAPYPVAGAAGARGNRPELIQEQVYGIAQRVDSAHSQSATDTGRNRAHSECLPHHRAPVYQPRTADTGANGGQPSAVPPVRRARIPRTARMS